MHSWCCRFTRASQAIDAIAGCQSASLCRQESCLQVPNNVVTASDVVCLLEMDDSHVSLWTAELVKCGGEEIQATWRRSLNSSVTGKESQQCYC